jgi:putative heme-binding domain-containing protein
MSKKGRRIMNTNTSLLYIRKKPFVKTLLVLTILISCGLLARSAQVLGDMARSPQAYRDYARTNPGDPEAGRLLFQKKHCRACHGLPGEGGDTGPDLKGIGSRHDREFLIKSILEPSASVPPGYGTVSIATKDGEMYVGRYLKSGPEGITLEHQGQPLTVPAANIASHKLTSNMPSGLEQRMSVEEFANVVAYLESLK